MQSNGLSNLAYFIRFNMPDTADNEDSGQRRDKLLRAESERLRLQLEDKIRILRNEKQKVAELKGKLKRKEAQIEILAGVKGPNVTLARQAREIQRLKQRINELTGEDTETPESTEEEELPYIQTTFKFD